MVGIIFVDLSNTLDSPGSKRPLHELSVACKIDGLVQDRSISIALAMEILQSCTKPSKCFERNVSNVSKSLCALLEVLRSVNRLNASRFH